MGGRRDQPNDPRLFRTLRSDVRHVTSDVLKGGIRREIDGTLGALERFYLSNDARTRLASMGRLRRWLHRAWWLLKGMLLKLTPPRRVLLALALIFIVTEITVVFLGVPLRFRQAGIVMLLLVVMLELKDKLVARDELEAGRKVQMALMPERSPHIPGWDAWLYTRPANDVGGDLVDHLQVDANRHGITLGDVAGKALPAALFMMKVQATLRALVPLFATLGELGGAANRILERDGLPNRFVTLVYFIVSTDSGDVRFLNAGHMPPLVMRAGRIDTLDAGSIPLGLMPDATFTEQRVDLADGDVLVAYSDGVTEATNPSGDFFGDDRLLAALRAVMGRSVDTIGESILQALATFADGAPPNDDVSLVVLKRQRR
jgi:serine phosphatase RsbU (regulator of sigma subunit)